MMVSNSAMRFLSLLSFRLASLAASACRSWEAERTFSMKRRLIGNCKVLTVRMVSRIRVRSALVRI